MNEYMYVYIDRYVFCKDIFCATGLRVEGLGLVGHGDEDYQKGLAWGTRKPGCLGFGV